MIVEFMMTFSAMVGLIIWLWLKKRNTIRTTGICDRNLYSSGGTKGMFSYEIDGKKYYNGENTTHFGSFKIGKKYTIYVKKNNHKIFFSRKVIVDMMVFIILAGILSIIEMFAVVMEMYH